MISECVEVNRLYKNRSRMEIIEDILTSAKRKTSKTRILHDANLNFRQLQEYLSFLEELELLVSEEFDEKTCYKTTEKGCKFLATFQEIKYLLRKHGTSSHNLGEKPEQLRGQVML